MADADGGEEKTQAAAAVVNNTKLSSSGAKRDSEDLTNTNNKLESSIQSQCALPSWIWFHTNMNNKREEHKTGSG